MSGASLRAPQERISIAVAEVMPEAAVEQRHSARRDELTLQGYRERFHWLSSAEHQQLLQDATTFLKGRFPSLTSSSWQITEKVRHNPSCGETTTVLWCRSTDGDASIWFYSGDQCALSLASGSLLMKLLEQSQSRAEQQALLHKLSREVQGVGMMQEGCCSQHPSTAFQDYLYFLQGLQHFPVRKRCFLINLEAALYSSRE